MFFHVCRHIDKMKVRYSPHIILCMGLYSNFQINIFNKKSQIVQDNKTIPFLPSLLLSIKEYLSVSWYHIIFQLYLRYQWQILSTNTYRTNKYWWTRYGLLAWLLVILMVYWHFGVMLLYSFIITNQDMPLFSHFMHVTCLGTSLSVSHKINVR